MVCSLGVESLWIPDAQAERFSCLLLACFPSGALFVYIDAELSVLLGGMSDFLLSPSLNNRCFDCADDVFLPQAS